MAELIVLKYKNNMVGRREGIYQLLIIMFIETTFLKLAKPAHKKSIEIYDYQVILMVFQQFRSDQIQFCGIQIRK